MTLSLPNEKRHNINQLVKRFSKLPRCTIREFAQLTGILVAACPAERYGFPYTKLLERQKFLALQQHHNNYENKITIIPKNVLEDLNCLPNHIFTAMSLIRNQRYHKEIYSDASRTGVKVQVLKAAGKP